MVCARCVSCTVTAPPQQVHVWVPGWIWILNTSFAASSQSPWTVLLSARKVGTRQTFSVAAVTFASLKYLVTAINQQIRSLVGPVPSKMGTSMEESFCPWELYNVLWSTSCAISSVDTDWTRGVSSLSRFFSKTLSCISAEGLDDIFLAKLTFFVIPFFKQICYAKDGRRNGGTSLFFSV